MQSYTLIDEMRDESIAQRKTDAIDAVKTTDTYATYRTAWTELYTIDRMYGPANETQRAQLATDYAAADLRATAAYIRLQTVCRHHRANLQSAIDAAQREAHDKAIAATTN